jgi:hypothetical protein
MGLFNVLPVKVEKTRNPNYVYFIPVISYLILVITHFLSIDVPLGLALAYVGIASITPSIQMLLVVYGLYTDRWYKLEESSKSNIELFVLSIFGLMAIYFGGYLLGEAPIFPPKEVWYWFILGFFGFIGMNETFNFFYDDNVENSATAFIMSMLVGLTYILALNMWGA